MIGRLEFWIRVFCFIFLNGISSFFFFSLRVVRVFLRGLIEAVSGMGCRLVN